MIDIDRMYHKPRPAFGTWLLNQKDRPGPIGELASAAASDRGFPASGDVKAVSKRLNATGADPEMHSALEDAETDWLCM